MSPKDPDVVGDPAPHPTASLQTTSFIQILAVVADIIKVANTYTSKGRLVEMFRIHLVCQLWVPRAEA